MSENLDDAFVNLSNAVRSFVQAVEENIGLEYGDRAELRSIIEDLQRFL